MTKRRTEGRAILGPFTLRSMRGMCAFCRSSCRRGRRRQQSIAGWRRHLVLVNTTWRRGRRRGALEIYCVFWFFTQCIMIAHPHHDKHRHHCKLSCSLRTTTTSTINNTHRSQPLPRSRLFGPTPSRTVRNGKCSSSTTWALVKCECTSLNAPKATCLKLGQEGIFLFASKYCSPLQKRALSNCPNFRPPFFVDCKSCRPPRP